MGIKTRGTGTNSVNTPLVAVGNTKYTGKNPPQYLNAEFNWFKVKDVKGEWVEMKDGTAIEVQRNSPILAMASAGNLQEAEWLTPERAEGKPGAVYLASTEESRLRFRKAILKNTPYLEDIDFGEFILSGGISKKTEVMIQMTAKGRAWFGEKLEFILVPK